MEATDFALGAGRMGMDIISMILHMIIEMPILIGPIVQDVVESAPRPLVALSYKWRKLLNWALIARLPKVHLLRLQRHDVKNVYCSFKRALSSATDLYRLRDLEILCVLCTIACFFATKLTGLNKCQFNFFPELRTYLKSFFVH